MQILNTYGFPSSVPLHKYPVVIHSPPTLYGLSNRQRCWMTFRVGYQGWPVNGNTVQERQSDVGGWIVTSVQIKYIWVCLSDCTYGRDGSVGIATRYGLDGPGIESRCGRDLLQACPGAHPASYTMGTSSFPGVKRSGRDVDYSPLLAPRLKKE